MRSEDLAYWYLRLNGCLTVPNFYLHPPVKGGALTEADIVAVRFPERAEFDDKDADDELFSQSDRTLFLVAEAKGNEECKVNPTWTRDTRALVYVLKRFGPVASGKEEEVAARWIETGGYKDCSVRCFFVCFAERRNDNLRTTHKDIQQRTWEQVLQFFHRRFCTYHSRKLDHSHWDSIGNRIWNAWEKEARRGFESFSDIIRKEFRLLITGNRAV